MKFALERHQYAPELNRVHIMRKGRVVATLAAAGCNSIKEARRALFAPAEPRIMVTAASVRDGEWAGLNRERRAAFPLRQGVMVNIFKQARALVDQGGTLIDGRALPPARLQLRATLGAITKGAAQ